MEKVFQMDWMIDYWGYWNKMPDSSISKFFEKSREERLKIIRNFANLSKDELDILKNSDGGISFEISIWNSDMWKSLLWKLKYKSFRSVSRVM